VDAAEHKKLVRVVNVVVLIVHAPGGSEPRLLVETGERYPDGRARDMVRLPGTKRNPHESTRETANRILRDMLRFAGAENEVVRFSLGRTFLHEEEFESPSYPGVMTVYRKRFVSGTVCTSRPDLLEKVGLPGFREWSAVDDKGYTKFFSWMPDDEAVRCGVNLGADRREDVLSTLVWVPTGLTEEMLLAQLCKHGIDMTRFGQGGAISFKDLAAELINGDAALVEKPSGALVRIVDEVCLHITNSAGDVLVQRSEVVGQRKTELNRLPCAMHRPDENHFYTARRLIRKQLAIVDDCVCLDPTTRVFETECSLPRYPGIPTLRRARFVKGELRDPPS